MSKATKGKKQQTIQVLDRYFHTLPSFSQYRKDGEQYIPALIPHSVNKCITLFVWNQWKPFACYDFLFLDPKIWELLVETSI